MASRDPTVLVDQAVAGDRSALARLLTLVERGGEPARAVARLVRPRTGRAYTVGVTGAPGAGKSTLTDALVHHLRGRGKQVGVLAVDPSSARTGGAILGDRLRMQGHAEDDGVFIRSLASRGHLGGLALAVPEAIRVLDAAGLSPVIVETVGVGQVEVSIAGAADTTVVVVTPGWGDAVQVSKAGLVEIADVLVVNKADRDGAEAAVQDLEALVGVPRPSSAGWRPPVVAASALDGTGVPEVWDAVTGHRSWLEASGQLDHRRRRRLAAELREVVQRRLERRAAELTGDSRFDDLVDEVAAGRLDQQAAADNLLTAAEAPEPDTTEPDR